MREIQVGNNIHQGGKDAHKGHPTTPATRDEVVQAQSYANPCGYPKTHDGSDLCAQWTAAVGARDSANWQAYAYPWHVGGTIGTGLSVLLSLVAAILAYRAFRSTQRTEIAQTRAYIFSHASDLFDGMHPDISEEYEGVPHVVFALKNSGHTPARNVRHAGELLLIPAGAEDQLQSPSTEGAVLTLCAPNGDLTYKRTLFADGPWCPLPETLEKVRKSEYVFVLNGKVTYEDVFGQTRFTTYRAGYSGKWPPSGSARLMFSNTGNDSD